MPPSLEVDRAEGQVYSPTPATEVDGNAIVLRAVTKAVLDYALSLIHI